MPSPTRRDLKNVLFGAFLFFGFIVSTLLGLLSAVVAVEAVYEGHFFTAVLAGMFAWFCLKGPSDSTGCRC